jgi:hypothetical protein
MADGKKTFIFYSDWINMVREMPNQDAGELLKHILSYVNDENPETKNLLVKMAFGHMKPMLKSDLDKWDRQLKKYSEMGKASAEKRKKQHKSTRVEPTLTRVKPMNTVNENVNVNDNVNVNVNKKKEGLILPFEDEDFILQWNNWKIFKNKEFKFKYKSLQSEQAALSKLNTLSNENQETAIGIIHQSMANGWKGFFELQKSKENETSKDQKRIERIKKDLTGW